jgi:nicotinamidase-related amidase
MLADRQRTQLVLIDIQARLAPHVAGGREVAANCRRLALYATRLGIPVTVTEHYPKGLGPTVPEVLEAAGEQAVSLSKISFSCWRDDAIRRRFQALADAGRDQIVVAGMEAHVCVGQTVLDLVAAGFHTMLVADAVGSRDDAVKTLAVARMRDAGVQIVAQEMMAFEWLGRGDDPAFKDLISLIK